MVGVVLVTHGNLGKELLGTAELIVGPMESICALSIHPQQSVEQIRETMAGAIREVDSGNGVLILTDMFGGTPANLALTFLEDCRVEVITGVNLPMLLKLGTSRQGPSTVVEIAQEITSYGQKNIVFASDLLGTTHLGSARQ